MIDLAFDLLPTIVRHQLFKGLPPFIEEPLTKLKLPETVDRLRAASLFLGEVGPSDKPWEDRAYLRAALSEFRSVTQALRWDLGTSQGLHSPQKSRNPLIHAVYRLRRLAVYVANAPTKEREVTASIQVFDKTHQAEIKVLLIDDVERYLRLGNLKDYKPEDVSRISNWIEENQRVYGAPQVLDVGVQQYCQELCDVYENRASSGQ